MKPVNLEKLKKMKRIAALVGVVFLAGMYVVSLIAALMKSETAHAIFMTSLYCSFVVPVIIYVLQMIYNLAAGRSKDEPADAAAVTDGTAEAAEAAEAAEEAEEAADDAED